jgi:hypothetical protein
MQSERIKKWWVDRKAAEVDEGVNEEKPNKHNRAGLRSERV